MIFDAGTEKRYKKAVNDAFDVILDKGNKKQKYIAREILESEMLVQIKPVAEVRASGITGIVSSWLTNRKINSQSLNLREALGELYIAIAEETIETGGQRGCEGTLIHESQHAYDFARTIESFSQTDAAEAKVFNPTLYELEWEAHQTSGEYMLRIGRDEYLQEGFDLMILSKTNDSYNVSADGIKLRLLNDYHLDNDRHPGATAAQILGIAPRGKFFSFRRFFGVR